MYGILLPFPTCVMKVASMSSKHEDALITTCTIVECGIADCCIPKGVPYVYCTLLVSDVMYQWCAVQGGSHLHDQGEGSSRRVHEVEQHDRSDGVPSHDSEGRGKHLQALRHHHRGVHSQLWYIIQYNISNVLYYISSDHIMIYYNVGEDARRPGRRHDAGRQGAGQQHEERQVYGAGPRGPGAD